MASKAAELRELNDAELLQRLAEAKEEHFNLPLRERDGSALTTPCESATCAGRSPRSCDTLLRERKHRRRPRPGAEEQQ